MGFSGANIRVYHSFWLRHWQPERLAYARDIDAFLVTIRNPACRHNRTHHIARADVADGGPGVSDADTSAGRESDASIPHADHLTCAHDIPDADRWPRAYGDSTAGSEWQNFQLGHR